MTAMRHDVRTHIVHMLRGCQGPFCAFCSTHARVRACAHSCARAMCFGHGQGQQNDMIERSPAQATQLG
eukprot:1531140-Alexandrium_andersonii.AAC.1